MKKIALFLLLIQGTLFAYPKVSPELSDAVKTIYAFPDSRKVLEKVEQDGPLSIYTAPFQSGSGAMWVPDERAIVINANSRKSFGETVRSILFELHNAYNSSEFDRLDHMAYNRKISKQDYVKAVEYLEFQNAVQTKKLLDKAIYQNYFPKDSWWCVPDDFNTHLQMQYECGHSAAIASLYDQMRRTSAA